MKITRKVASPFLKVAFPTYNGRKIEVEFVESVFVENLNWDGGVKNKYVAINCNNVNETVMVPSLTPWTNPFERKSIPLGENVIVVCLHSYHNRRSVTIYAHPSRAKMFEAPK